MTAELGVECVVRADIAGRRDRLGCARDGIQHACSSKQFRSPEADDDNNNNDDAAIDGTVNPKLLVPEAISLGTYLATRTAQQRQRATRVLGPSPTTPQGQITHSPVGGQVYPNPFSEFKAAAVALMGDLHSIAVEFPVYFGMLAADNTFMYACTAR